MTVDVSTPDAGLKQEPCDWSSSEQLSMKRTGAQILWECLVREGVDDVFGYPGGAILPAYDAMLDFPIRHVLVRHEQGATHMADGYARASGRVGVAIATSGPGATNMVTGIATAMMDSSPIVCITGQVGSKLIGTDAFQETDITGVTLPITKHNYLVTRAEDVGAGGPRGVPHRRERAPGPGADRHHQGRAADLVRVRLGRRRAATARAARARADPTAIADALRAHQRGRAPADPRRPRHHPRRRRRTSCASSPSTRDIPIAMTLLGIGGFPASHPLNLGMMGMHGEAWVNTAIQEADLLLAFGMRFDDRVTGNLKTYAPNASKIHIDIDPAEIGKNVKVDVGIVGDLRDDARDAAAAASRAGDRARWLEHIDELKGDSAVRDIQNLPDDGHLYAAHVIHDLWRTTDGQGDRRHRRRPASDVGGAVLPPRRSRARSSPPAGSARWASRCRRRSAPSSRCPDAEVWAVVGDGGFQMTMPELATIAQEKLDINVAIINNGYLGHGAAVAGVLLRAPLRRDAAPQPGLREARRGLRPGGTRGRRAARRHAGRRAPRARTRARRSSTSGRAGRHGVSDGAGRRRPARDDSPAEPAASKPRRMRR